MSRYYIYNYSDIGQTNPSPTSIYSFNVGSANTGSLIFGGGNRTNPQLNILASSVTNYYNGYNIRDVTLGETRQIVGYNGTTKTVTLDSPFSVGWSFLDTYTITDPTNWFYLHLQPNASTVNDFYNDCILVDSVTRLSVYVYGYDGNTRIASINTFLPTETLV